MRLFALLALLLFAAQQQPNPHVRSKEPSVSERNAQAEADDKQQELHGSPSVTIQECQHCTVIEKCIGCSTEENPRAQCKQTDPYNPKKDTLYRAYLWFTIFGVLAALGGISAIYRQTTATRDAAVATRVSAEASERSAKATERSVKLQENTQRQWVDLRDWRVYRIQPDQPVEIEFKITNPTVLPLTIHGAVVTVDGKRVDEELPITLVTPNDPVPHSIGVSLNPEQNALYERDALHFEVDCAIMFADSHNIHWVQEIGIRLLCGRSGNPIITVRKHKLYESGVPGEHGSRDVELP